MARILFLISGFHQREMKDGRFIDGNMPFTLEMNSKTANALRQTEADFGRQEPAAVRCQWLGVDTIDQIDAEHEMRDTINSANRFIMSS
jgi:hypothetical protein